MMPIALLLEEVAGTLKRGATELNPWVRLVQVEETLIARARSVFLTRWFGPQLPMDGLDVRVAIANIDALNEKYQQVARETRRLEREAQGPSLVEPLFGVLGGLLGGAIGMMANPVSWGVNLVGAIGGKVKASRAVVSFFGGIFGTPIVGLVGLPVGLALYGQHLELGRPVAAAIDAFNGFMGQILGDRKGVKNPLVRGVLEVLDGFARLMAQVTGVYAILVTRIGPRILPTVEQFILVFQIGGLVKDAAMAIIDQVQAKLTAVKDWRNLAVVVVLLDLRKPIALVGAELKLLFTHLSESYKHVGSQLRTAVKAVFDAVKAEFVGIVTPQSSGRPDGDLIADIIWRMKYLTPTLKFLITMPPPSKPGLGARIANAAYDAFAKTIDTIAILAPPTPSLKLPNAVSIERMLGGRPGVPISELAKVKERAAERFPTNDPQLRMLAGLMTQEEYEETMRKQMSLAEPPVPLYRVFEAKAAELRRGEGVVVAARSKELVELNKSIDAIVSKIGPPVARAEAIVLNAKLEKKRQLPILDVRTSEKLRPIVRRLTLVGNGLEERELVAFRDRLRKALDGREYTVRKVSA